jgi:hypothetical protein
MQERKRIKVESRKPKDKMTNKYRSLDKNIRYRVASPHVVQAQAQIAVWQCFYPTLSII